MYNKYNKDKYKKDFPDRGRWNFKTVKLKTPDCIYWDGHTTIGVVLHDGNLMAYSVLFLANQFEIINEDPFNNFQQTH